jgi:hypothetical protein
VPLVDFPTRAALRPSAPLEPDASNDMAFLCEHYARSTTRRQRWLFVSGITDDAHTALVWLLDRAMCLIEQLPPEAGQSVRLHLPDEEDQALLLEALAEGTKYELVCTVIQPEQSANGSHYVEADTTHVFTIEPQPADPVPAGTGRRRRTPDRTDPRLEA